MSAGAEGVVKFLPGRREGTEVVFIVSLTPQTRHSERRVECARGEESPPNEMQQLDRKITKR